MTTAPTPATMTARSPEDLLAVAPILLGFWPEESTVMLTFGAQRPFHARVDLPPLDQQDARVRRTLRDLLVDPAHRNGARGVVLIHYTADRAAAAAVHRVLERGLRRCGIEIHVALVADGRHYRDITGRPDGTPSIPYDVSSHPFVLEALVDGRITHDSRGAMVASLEAVPDQVERVERAIGASGLPDSGVPASGRAVRAHGQWVADTLAEALRTGQELTDDATARLVWVMQASRVRDAAWSLITRSSAADHVRLWTAVLRRTPEALAAEPAALLGWAAWQSGDGALAWAAVDRCRRVAPEHALAESLASMLQHAVAPELWRECWTGDIPADMDWTLGLPPLSP